MNAWDITATAILGWLSVPLVSLTVRKHWPDQLKFVIAAALSVGFAVGELWLHHKALTTTAIMGAAWTCLIAQQATWHLKLPLMGSATLNQQLLTLGSNETDVGQPNPEGPVEDPPEG